MLNMSLQGLIIHMVRWEKVQWKHLPFHSQRTDFLITVVDKLQFEDEKLVQLRFESCIKEGEMERLSSFTWAFLSYKGQVIHGEKRGRKIGFPTANVDIDDEYLFPPTGVYAVRLKDQR